MDIIIIFIFLNIFQSINNDEVLYERSLDLENTHSLCMLNGNIFILHKNGVLVYNYNFTIILHSYDFEGNTLIASELDNNFTSLIQCNDNNKNYIFALINNKIYVFSSKGLFLFKINNVNLFSNFSTNVEIQYYSFLYYKYEDSIYYFIVSFINNHNLIQVKEFSININTHLFNELKTKTFGEKIISDSVACEITSYNDYENVLACFYIIENTSSIDIMLSMLNLENNFSLIIEKIVYQGYGNSNEKNFLIKSPMRKGKRIIFIAILNFGGNTLTSTSFDLDSLQAQTKGNLFSCSIGTNLININYLDIINTYIYSCKNSDGINFKIIKDISNISNYERTGSIKYLNCSNLISYDIIFPFLYKKYMVIGNFLCGNFSTELYNFPSYLIQEIQYIPSIEPDNEYIIYNYSSTTNPNTIDSTIQNTILNIVETTIPTTIYNNIQTTIPTTIYNNIETTIPTTIYNYIETTVPTTLFEPIITTIPSTIFNTHIIEIITTTIKTTLPSTNVSPIETEIKTTIASSSIYNEFCQLKKCLSCNEESLSSNLCISCNIKEDYYPSIKNGITNYFECYNQETKPKNFYFNEENKYYEPCFTNCKTCKFKGDKQVNNCTSCKKDYIFRPDVKNSTNCVENCKYYYYISYGKYSCTNNNQCPTQANLLIKEKKRCIDSCKNDDDYKYEFNYECIEKCPDEAEADEDNVCRLKNKKKCYLYSDYFLNVNYYELESSNFSKLITRYIKGFEDTDFHVDFYQSQNYSITIYKTLECLKELEMASTYINFGECYKKVQEAYNFTNRSLIILISDFFNRRILEYTSFYFFNPDNGVELPIDEVCKNQSFTIEKSLTYYSDIDIEKAKFFDKQNINIFNTSDVFYNDLCFFFESPNGKDVPLKERIKLFYPNVTLCDESCNNIGVNVTSMKAICECTLKNLLEETKDATKLVGLDFSSLIDSLSLDVMICYKTIFQYKYFIKCYGGMFSIFLIITQSICVIIAVRISIPKIRKVTFDLLGNYCSLLGSLKPKNMPPKKSIKLNLIDDSKHKSSNKKVVNRKSIKINTKKNFIKLDKRTKKSKSLIIKNKIISNKLNHSKTINIDNSMSLLNNELKLKNYLETSMDELDYDETLVREKRTFCKIFLDKLVIKQRIINLFYSKVWIIPKSIRTIFLIVMIDLYFVINAIFYNEEYISKLYHSNKKETLFSFVLRSLNRIVYTSAASSVLDFIISLFFPIENKIKKILIRKKNNISEMRTKVFRTINRIINNYWIFIGISYALTIFSWYYITCFNNVYPYLKIEWIKLSIFIIILMQIISILICFLYAVFRVLSIKCKSEKIYRISNYFSN